MTDHNMRAERQGTMRGGKSRAIQALTVCSSVTTETIAPAVDTRDFGPANPAKIAGRRCSSVGSGRAPRHEPQDLTEVRQALTGFSEARSGGVNICAETVPKALETL
jgi:hypothetical protein